MAKENEIIAAKYRYKTISALFLSLFIILVLYVTTSYSENVYEAILFSLVIVSPVAIGMMNANRQKIILNMTNNTLKLEGHPVKYQRKEFKISDIGQISTKLVLKPPFYPGSSYINKQLKIYDKKDNLLTLFTLQQFKKDEILQIAYYIYSKRPDLKNFIKEIESVRHW